MFTLLGPKDFLTFKRADCLCQLSGPFSPQKGCWASVDLNVQIKVISSCLLISWVLIPLCPQYSMPSIYIKM